MIGRQQSNDDEVACRHVSGRDINWCWGDNEVMRVKRYESHLADVAPTFASQCVKERVIRTI